MPSKYDDYWHDLDVELRHLIEMAARGHRAEMDVSGLQSYGQRASWYGQATIQGQQVELRGPVHVKSLLRMVANRGLCAHHPDAIFLFTIDERCQLKIAVISAAEPRLARSPQITSTEAAFPRAVVDELVAALRTRPHAEKPADFLAGTLKNPVEVAGPGLYSWWCDDVGRDQLSKPLQDALLKDTSSPLLPELIYAGLAGAKGRATLFDRIQSRHLGTFPFSTLRRTLAALLREPLSLHPLPGGKLTKLEEQRLNTWIFQHLEVVPVRYEERVTLRLAEFAVLHELNPPLNIKHMPSTHTRRLLRKLRAAWLRNNSAD